jgi:hypothetical protein
VSHDGRYSLYFVFVHVNGEDLLAELGQGARHTHAEPSEPDHCKLLCHVSSSSVALVQSEATV